MAPPTVGPNKLPVHYQVVLPQNLRLYATVLRQRYQVRVPGTLAGPIWYSPMLSFVGVVWPSVPGTSYVPVGTTYRQSTCYRP